MTNTAWFANLLEACLAARVDRLVLISFPHVEGPTTPESPASGRLDGAPVSVHARTRLEEERLLFSRTARTATTPVCLRLGMVYGRGILMIEAARWLARHHLLAVSPQPTWIHLISTADFLAATVVGRQRRWRLRHLPRGRRRTLTLQRFLDEACAVGVCAAPGGCRCG